MNKINIISTFILLAKICLCSIDRDKYLELNKVNKQAYLTADKCGEVFMCNIFNREYNALEDCYIKDRSSSNIIINGDEYTNPDNCPNFHRSAYVKGVECYLTSNGKTKVGNSNKGNARYYSIDYSNRRVLTEWGWCEYEHLNDNDVNWMSKLSDDTRINQINIPGTHDSGTCKIPYESFASTQNFSIMGQLHLGIRFLDIRLQTNEAGEISISHASYGAINPVTNKKYYLSDIVSECVAFLRENPSETIIMYLREEDIHYHKDVKISEGKDETIYCIDSSCKTLLGDVIKSQIVDNALFKDYIYYNNTIPSLEKARSNIVLLQAHKYNRRVNSKGLNEFDSFGIPIWMGKMGDCTAYNEYARKSTSTYKIESCYPTIWHNFRAQDASAIANEEDKWNLVHDVLTNNVPSRNASYVVQPQASTNVFYNDKSKLTLNWMNISLLTDFKFPDGLVELPIRVIASLFGSSIEKKADYINNKLIEYTEEEKSEIFNQWLIMDFPSSDVIRSVYQSNFNTNELKPFLNILNIYMDTQYYILGIFNLGLGISKRDKKTEDQMVCLQRKSVTDKQGNQTDLVKTDYKCVNNSKNKWYVNSNGSYYNIISAYDGKCLGYSENGLHMEKCKSDNKYEQFSIEDGIICPRNRVTNCLNSSFNFHPTILEPSEYQSLSCSSRFVKSGYKCCHNQNAKVEKVDEIGNWAKENGEWCGIGYDRCTFELAGYHCCSSVNPEVVDTDDLGQWGLEDGEKCGIGEIKRPNGPYRIRNIKTNKCLVTKANDKNKIYVGDCSEYNDNNKYTQWYWNNTQIVSAQYNGRYMYVMNYKNAVLGSDSDVLGQDNVYSHFEFNNNGTFCIKYDGKQYCLRQTNENDKEINFELLSNSAHEMFQWRIENLDRSDYNVITSIDWYPYNPDRNNDPPKNSPPSDSDCPVDDYPCCSPEITEVIYTDDKGDWGSENGDWCLIFNSSQSSEPECRFQDYPCCADQNTNVVATDDTGSWGFEYGDWCHILSDITVTTPTPTCSSKFTELGYPCCSDPNTAVVSTDATGSWGIENGDWCGISDDNTTAITTTTTTTNIPTPTNYRCGPKFNNMKCNPGYCCSKKGYCGATMDYCGTGCQSEFGDCKCGPMNSNHICPDNKCCSKKGYCGTTNAYCGTGCQSEFGKCNMVATTTTTPTTTIISYQTINSKDTPVWIYNPNLKQCLYAQSAIASEKQSKPYKPLIGNCGSNNKFKWYFDSHNKSYIHSALNINKCLYLDDVENGKLKVDNCNNKDNSVFEYVSNGLIKSPLSPNECLGKGDRNNDSSNANGGYLKLCDKTDDQKWEIRTVFPGSQ